MTDLEESEEAGLSGTAGLSLGGYIRVWGSCVAEFVNKSELVLVME